MSFVEMNSGALPTQQGLTPNSARQLSIEKKVQIMIIPWNTVEEEPMALALQSAHRTQIRAEEMNEKCRLKVLPVCYLDFLIVFADLYQFSVFFIVFTKHLYYPNVKNFIG